MYLETERLILREMTGDDLDVLTEIQSDPIVMRFYPQTYNREESNEILQGILQGYKNTGYHRLATIDKKTKQFIGRCGIADLDLGDQVVPEIGYMLRKEWWGKGFATEAARALRDYGFENLGFNLVISLIRPINTPSQAVARRSGMRIMRDVIYKDFEHHVFGITREEWNSLAAVSA